MLIHTIHIHTLPMSHGSYVSLDALINTIYLYTSNESWVICISRYVDTYYTLRMSYGSYVLKYLESWVTCIKVSWVMGHVYLEIRRYILYIYTLRMSHGSYVSTYLESSWIVLSHGSHVSRDTLIHTIHLYTSKESRVICIKVSAVTCISYISRYLE